MSTSDTPISRAARSAAEDQGAELQEFSGQWGFHGSYGTLSLEQAQGILQQLAEAQAEAATTEGVHVQLTVISFQRRMTA